MFVAEGFVFISDHWIHIIHS